MLTINIDIHSSIPMYEQIYNYIKNEIKNGNLPFRYKLPSTRNLAVNLQVSRNTVDMSYAQLVSEGYIEAIPKSGYYVAMVSDLMHITQKHPVSPKALTKSIISYQYDFSPFAIDINSFPFNIWRKLSKNCMNEYNNDLFLLGNNQGDENLRAAIGRYLHESRGVNCSEDQIIIGAGADYLLQLLSQLFQYVKNINCIAMENPTYKQAYKIFTGLRYSVTPIDLDHNGIRIQPLKESEANVVYVTPSHQYPLGIVMPIKRRMELLQWADKAPDRYIIEDDHDSEFRYKGKPIPSLQGIDSSGKVIYLGTFSRAVAPAIRVGYMVLPKKLLELYKQNLYHYSSTVSRVDQNIITHFITDGYFERHLNKMRKLYKGKHDLLVQSLKIFKDKVTLEGENGGLHLVLHFLSNASEKEIIEAAAKKSIKLYGLSEHYLNKPEPPPMPSILLGYANMTEAGIPDGIHALYNVLEDYFI
ncbi:MAG: PLP-dependent aminotransferase family protein [Anaerocolumna sp.]